MAVKDTVTNEELIEVLKHGLCGGCRNEVGQELHVCPLRLEIFNTWEECNCCDECIAACAEEI